MKLPTAQSSSFVVLLFAPVVLGAFSRPAEAAVCVLAGALGLAFSNLDKFKRIKGGGFEAELREQLDAINAKESEPDDEPDNAGIQIEAFGFDENTKMVISALNSSNYTWRSIGGICQETGLSRSTVISKLSWLDENDLAMQVDISKRTNWGLSDKGRDIARSLENRTTKAGNGSS